MSEVSDLIDEFDDGRVFTSQKDHRLSDDEILEYKAGNILLSGVYLLYDGDTVVYVGRANVLVRRLYEHYINMERVKAGKKPHGHGRAFTFTAIRIFSCEPEKLSILERTMIARYRPRYNIQMVPPLFGRKLTLEQVGFRYDKLGLTKPFPLVRRDITPTPIPGFKRRF